MAGKLEKLKLTAYSDVNFSKKGTSFSVMINPESYKHKYSIQYNADEPMGSEGSSPKFQKMGDEAVSFKCYIDGTGAVQHTGSGTVKSVKDQLKDINAIVYKYNGKSHEPNYIQLLWGTLIFYCRLSSLDVNYTLFKPSGEPLRAELDFSLTGFMSEEKVAAKANNNSPDLTHIITVRPGDTLPYLCSDIYRDSSLYLKIAEINKLTNFRILTPGQKLIFPPLVNQ